MGECARVHERLPQRSPYRFPPTCWYFHNCSQSYSESAEDWNCGILLVCLLFQMSSAWHKGSFFESSLYLKAQSSGEGIKHLQLLHSVLVQIWRMGCALADCTTLTIPKLFQSWPVLYLVNLQAAQTDTVIHCRRRCWNIRHWLDHRGPSDTSLLQSRPVEKRAFNMESLIQYEVSH